MAAVADLKQRFGVGWGGVVLYLVVFLGGTAVVELLGDLPTGGVGRRGPLEVVVPGVVFGLGLAGVVLAAANLPTYIRLARTAGVDAADVAAGADGRVVLTGTAEPLEGTLSTPFGGTDAVAYTTRVLKNSHDDAETARESEENWGVVNVGEATTRLAVDDGTGAAAVDPGDARLHLSGRDSEMVAAGEPLPAGAREHLTAADVDANPDEVHLRFEEAALEPGEAAFVLGTAGGGSVTATLLAEGDHARRVRGRVHRGGAFGLLAAGAGYLGLLIVAGAV